DVPVLASALENQRRVGPSRLIEDRLARPGRPDLLVRGAGGGDGPDPAAPGRLQALDGEEAGQETALHVGHARPERAVTLDAEGTLGDGPGVEHRIGMPDHHDPGATAALEAPDHEVAELLLVAGGC